jgi:hypothetical protein
MEPFMELSASGTCLRSPEPTTKGAFLAAYFRVREEPLAALRALLA